MINLRTLNTSEQGQPTTHMPSLSISSVRFSNGFLGNMGESLVIGEEAGYDLDSDGAGPSHIYPEAEKPGSMAEPPSNEVREKAMV